jgi:hypothetical protein
MHFRLSYLPPLMVYLVAGVAGLTAIVGTFFVKEYLDLTAEALGALLITLSIAIMIGLVFEPDMLLSRASATTRLFRWRCYWRRITSR